MDLKAYVREAREEGFRDEEIRKKLQRAGYPSEPIDTALKRHRWISWIILLSAIMALFLWYPGTEEPMQAVNPPADDKIPLYARNMEAQLGRHPDITSLLLRGCSDSCATFTRREDQQTCNALHGLHRIARGVAQDNCSLEGNAFGYSLGATCEGIRGSCPAGQAGGLCRAYKDPTYCLDTIPDCARVMESLQTQIAAEKAQNITLCETSSLPSSLLCTGTLTASCAAQAEDYAHDLGVWMLKASGQNVSCNSIYYPSIRYACTQESNLTALQEFRANPQILPRSQAEQALRPTYGEPMRQPPSEQNV